MKPSKCTLLCLISAFYFLAIFSSQVELVQARAQSADATIQKRSRKTKIFIIGATGKFGRYVVEASVKAKQPTVALVRPSALNDPVKAELVNKYTNWGVKIVYGDFILNETIIVNTMKRVDVVISCVSQTLDQTYIIEEIKKAGCIKRFFPSEYGIDVDRVHDPVDPAATLFAGMAQIRRAIEAANIPHTFFVANGFAGNFWPNLAQTEPLTLLPNITEAVAYGDGNSKIIATLEADIATYIIKAVDDPRTLNKNVYLKPKANIISYNDLFTLWEKKSGAILKRTLVSEAELLELIKDPTKYKLSVCYSIAIKNDYDSYVIDPSFGVEATELYPEVIYTTISEYYENLAMLSTQTQTKASF